MRGLILVMSTITLCMGAWLLGGGWLPAGGIVLVGALGVFYATSES